MSKIGANFEFNQKKILSSFVQRKHLMGGNVDPTADLPRKIYCF